MISLSRDGAVKKIVSRVVHMNLPSRSSLWPWLLDHCPPGNPVSACWACCVPLLGSRSNRLPVSMFQKCSNVRGAVNRKKAFRAVSVKAWGFIYVPVVDRDTGDDGLT